MERINTHGKIAVSEQKGINIFKVLSVIMGFVLAIVILELFLHYSSAGYLFENRRVTLGSKMIESICENAFIKKNYEGKKYYFHNRKKHLKHPAFQETKPKDEVRIFLVGESAADILYGYKHGPEYEDNKLLRNILEKRFPEKEVNIVNAGFGGYNSAQIVSVCKEIVQYEPDIVIVLMGNNFSELPKWEMSILRNRPYFKSLYKSSRVYNLLVNYLYSLERGDYEFKDFRRDYEIIGSMFQKRGITFVPVVLPVNYSDIPPYMYYSHYRDYILTRLMIESGEIELAIEFIKSNQNIRSDSVAQYLYAKANRISGNTEEAKKYFKEALNHEYSRAGSAINQIVKDTADKYDGLLLDLEVLFEKYAPEGILGREMFYDGCHWYDYELNPLIFEEIVRVLNKRKVADVSPVSINDSFSIKKLKRLKPVCNQERIKGFHSMAVLNSLLGFFELGVFQLENVYSFYPELVKDIPSRINDDFINSLNYEGNLGLSEKQMKENWPIFLTAAAEASRHIGNLEDAERLIQAALYSLEDYKSQNIILSWICSGFIHYEKGENKEALRLFNLAINESGYEEYKIDTLQFKKWIKDDQAESKIDNGVD